MKVQFLEERLLRERQVPFVVCDVDGPGTLLAAFASRQSDLRAVTNPRFVLGSEVV